MSLDDRLTILQHALGLDQYATPVRGSVRNYFIAGSGTADYDICVDLSSEGLMTQAAGNEITGGNDLFRVTQTGIDWVHENSLQAPRKTASQSRYLRFLEQDCGMKFGDWLRSDRAR